MQPLCFRFKDNEREAAIVKEQEIDEALLALFEVVAQCIQVFALAAAR